VEPSRGRRLPFRDAAGITDPIVSGVLAAWIALLALFDLGLYCEWPAVWVTQQARIVEWFAEDGGLRRENGECGSVARTVFSACSVSRFQRPASGH